MPKRFHQICHLPTTLRCGLAACAIGLVILGFSPNGALASGSGGEGGGSGSAKTAFAPGNHKLQLPPMWVPVEGLRSRTPGVPVYQPVTIFLTSQENGIMKMCYSLPYLTEAFLFVLNDPVLPTADGGTPDLTGLDIRLLNAAKRITGPSAVQSVSIVNGVPYPDKANQEMLALCQ